MYIISVISNMFLCFSVEYGKHTAVSFILHLTLGSVQILVFGKLT